MVSSDASLLTIVAASCTVGCWLVHALGTYVHEQGHRLIVQREPWATVVDVVIEMGITSFGTGTAYQYRHVNFHHRYLGDCLPRTNLEPQGPPRPFSDFATHDANGLTDCVALGR